MFDHLQNSADFIARLLGALLGVVATMMIIAPESTRNALYRMWVGITMGAIFSPILSNFNWLSGVALDLVIARSAASGFIVWFILEGTARFLSNTDWLVKFAQEILRLRNGGGDK